MTIAELIGGVLLFLFFAASVSGSAGAGGQ
jgi:hypothetical protein